MSYSRNRLDEIDRVGYDPTTDTFHNQCDVGDPDAVCLAIVETVSAVTGKEPTAIEPLYSVLDPVTLESLLSTGTDCSVEATFTIEGCTVSVTGSGEIVVTMNE